MSEIAALTDAEIAQLARITPSDIARANADLQRHPALLAALNEMEQPRRNKRPNRRKRRVSKNR